MQTTKQLLDRAKKAQGIESDYALSKHLGVVQSAVTHWRSGRSSPDDGIAAHLAEMAGQEPAAVIAELHAARAKTPEVRAIWLRMADQLRHAVAAVMLAAGVAMLLLAPSPNGAQAGQQQSAAAVSGSVYYVNNALRRVRRRVVRWAGLFRRLARRFGGKVLANDAPESTAPAAASLLPA